jgi:hypothetical protein
MLKETGTTVVVAPPAQDLKKESIAGAVARFFSLLSCLAVIFYCFEVKWFSLHPVLMSFAFTYLISEGILTAREMKNRPMDRKQLVQSHLFLQFGTLVFGGFGFLVILSNKIYYNNKHFQTWHSILGLITIVGICIEVLIGLYIQYRWLRNVLRPLLPQTVPPAQNGGATILPTTIAPVLNMDLQPTITPPTTSTLPPAKKKRAKTSTIVSYIHRLLGLTVFIAGLITMGTGLRSNFFVERAPIYVQIPIFVCLVGIGICILFAMRRGKVTSSAGPSSSTAMPSTPKRTAANLLGSLGGPSDMLSFLPTTVTAPPPSRDVNTAKDK